MSLKNSALSWLGARRHNAATALKARRYPGRDSRGVDEWATDAEVEGLAGAAATDFARMFFAHDGRKVAKWTPYLDAYDGHLSRFRNTDVGLLEIGVFEGGSLELWRSYLGPDARILGVDIEPACATRVDPPNRVLIGSQADPVFLRRAVEEIGRLDVVVDDGSHQAKHQMVSFKTLFPLVEPGGLYIIEDMHTAYWYSFDGGRGRPGTAVDLARRIIDDMHGWHHDAPQTTEAQHWVPAVHVYDSMVVIEKARRSRPRALTVGGDDRRP